MDRINNEALKDILWYLRGAIELRSITELNSYHLSSLSNAIIKIGQYQSDEKAKVNVG